MSKHIAVLEPGGELKIVPTDKKYMTECAKEYTGKNEYIDKIPLNKERNFFIIVNEDGLYLDLPVNFLVHTTSLDFPI